MLSTIAAAPGVCMHIIGMLRAPTSPSLYVWNICGAYWNTARKAEVRPRNVAQWETRAVVVVGEGLGNEERRTRVIRDIMSLGGWLAGETAKRMQREMSGGVQVNCYDPRDHDAQPPLVGLYLCPDD